MKATASIIIVLVMLWASCSVEDDLNESSRPTMTFVVGARGVVTGTGDAVLGATRDEILRAFGQNTPREELGESVLVWDELGVLAVVDLASGTVNEFEVVCSAQPDGLDPKKPFAGRISLYGASMDCGTTREELGHHGLEPGVHGWYFLRSGDIQVILETFVYGGIERFAFSAEPELSSATATVPSANRTVLQYVERLLTALGSGERLGDIEPSVVTGGETVTVAKLRAVWTEVVKADRLGSEELGHPYSACELVSTLAVLGKALTAETTELLLLNGWDRSEATRECVLAVLGELLPQSADQIVACARSATDVRFADWCLRALEDHRAEAPVGMGWRGPESERERQARVDAWVAWWKETKEEGKAPVDVQ